MILPDFFISCDWGTTNFRLRLVETASLTILKEHKTDQGVKALYEKFLLQKEMDQRRFYEEYLLEQLQSFPEEHRTHLVVAAGMASSSIGLCELDYAPLPFDHSGKTFIWKSYPLQNGQKLLLISGVKSPTGMMRGEEVQAIGLEKHIAVYGEGTLLLPGTHSKHLAYGNGQFSTLKNYMTGELFEVLTKKSILANSVLPNNGIGLNESAFREGAKLGIQGQLTASLLAVRAKDVVEGLNKEDNYFFLSGLLIGDELSYLKNRKENVFLAAPNPVFELYKKVLELIVDRDRLVLFDGSILEKALLEGQKKIIQYAT